MQRTGQIDPDAPFSAAFRGQSGGWKWVSNVIGAGASFGILTSLMVAMLGQARYMCVIGRSKVVPAWFAKVHHKTCTPVNASAFLGTLQSKSRTIWYWLYSSARGEWAVSVRITHSPLPRPLPYILFIVFYLWLAWTLERGERRPLAFRGPT